jgi:hypothetical protein
MIKFKKKVLDRSYSRSQKNDLKRSYSGNDQIQIVPTQSVALVESVPQKSSNYDIKKMSDEIQTMMLNDKSSTIADRF